jgi:RNA polymerase sigma factor (sigma-70 family)
MPSAREGLCPGKITRRAAELGSGGSGTAPVTNFFPVVSYVRHAWRSNSFENLRFTRFYRKGMRMVSDTKSKPLVGSTGEETFETVFKRYYPLVYQLAYRCTGRREEADDIAQEAFLRFYRTPPRATCDQERRAWLCRVATNLGLNTLRSRQRRISHEEQAGRNVQESVPAQTGEMSPEQHAIDHEQSAFIRSVLAELPERQQTYILLRSVGLSYAEIAQATGVAPASVGSLLARAEREFRRRYHERASATKI